MLPDPLKGAGMAVPTPYPIVGPFVRREAVSSSRIEGTITNFEQLLLFEVDPTNDELKADRQEVSNYVRALEYGLQRLKELPVSLRLLREVHEVLMQGVRGEDKRPGEFREIQNMIGREGQSVAEARFVPPPVPDMREALDGLERYIGYPSGLPILIDCALIHYQFEVIHPFLDGNGRLGRLIIPLLLCERGILPQPLLYLSAYLERHRDRYIDHLLSVSLTGDWSGWINFFLRAVGNQSWAAINRCDELLALWSVLRGRFRATKRSSKALRLIDTLFERPALTVRDAAELLNVSFPAAQAVIDKLVEKVILTEVTGKSRNRVYVAQEIIAVFEKDDPTELD